MHTHTHTRIYTLTHTHTHITHTCLILPMSSSLPGWSYDHLGRNPYGLLEAGLLFIFQAFSIPKSLLAESEWISKHQLPDYLQIPCTPSGSKT